MINDSYKKLIINALYKNMDESNENINIYIVIIWAMFIVNVLILIYLSQNILFHITVNIILISILLLNVAYIIVSIINTKLKKNYLYFSSIKCMNTLKLIDEYSNMGAIQFDTVWDITLQGYASGKYRINNLDERAFRKIRKINKIYFGILKNSDIIVLNENSEILVNRMKIRLIDYLKTCKIEIREEVIEEVLDIQDVENKIQDKIEINIFNLVIYKVIYFCNKLSYFIMWVVICKMVIF